MAEPERNDHGTRIALLEQARKDDKQLLQKMADDMAKIAHAVAQQAEDRSALKRAFDQLEAHSKILESISSRMNKHDLDEKQRVIDAQALAIQATASQRKGVIAELWRTAGVVIATVTAAMILYHYGIKP